MSVRALARSARPRCRSPARTTKCGHRRPGPSAHAHGATYNSYSADPTPAPTAAQPAPWSGTEKFVADNAAPGDYFGESVAINGDVLVGAHFGDDHEESLPLKEERLPSNNAKEDLSAGGTRSAADDVLKSLEDKLDELLTLEYYGRCWLN